MNYPSIRIEGAIFSPDILERIEDSPGQRPADFGFDATVVKVKDEIARAWADAQDYWRIFQRRLETLKPESPGTTETRQQWIVPLLGLLGYQLEYQAKGVELNGKNYPISHRAINRGDTPVHIIGYREPAGLDRKPDRAAFRMSAHAMIQEYLNLQEELYALVTNGRMLRLLRDSSRLVKLSYLEFDLDRIFTDGLFADFALLFRLLHASRLPASIETSAESLIERYHQDSLDSGARIRDGLSRAVEQAIHDFANGFLSHPENEPLRQVVGSGKLKPDEFYQNLLRLIYRILFIMVIEERDLVFPPSTSRSKRLVYSEYYSLQRLRKLSEKRYLADRRRHDLWLSLCATFGLFEAHGPGEKLGIEPLAGDLFHPQAIGPLGKSLLGNDVLLGCIRSLSLYQHPDNRQVLRVNYAALNVEEFGSVYEGLLEYEPVFLNTGDQIQFAFRQGDERAATGSHYTPDDLVQPLIKHSLDYLISAKLKEADPENALLSLRVADIACGSGHILLAAARRVATELAIVRTGEDQPSPPALRAAIRDVIRECIYGVDLNPLAVELCKVALWLEAHIPGEPLNFLDHHIKCGNSIVGFVRREELERGVPNEAFATMPGDDKKTASDFRKRNKAERDKADQTGFQFSASIEKQLGAVLERWRDISRLPEHTPDEIAAKKKRYLEFTEGGDAWTLSWIAAMPIAQFYIPKTPENREKLITDPEFRRFLAGECPPQGQAPAAAFATSWEKRFFHWFLEFPEIMERGGFDCILGNPPYLGGTYLSGTYGYPFCHYAKWAYVPAGLSDLVAYFVRRIHNLLLPRGFSAIITTNSIMDGDIRKDGLEQLLRQGAAINFAVRGVKWPGRANLVVSIVGVYNGEWQGPCILDGVAMEHINAHLEAGREGGNPLVLNANLEYVFVGSEWGGDAFFVSEDRARQLVETDSRYCEVVRSVINGDELNSHPTQTPQRHAIYFSNWSRESAAKYLEAFDIVNRNIEIIRREQPKTKIRDRWWLFRRPTVEMYSRLKNKAICFVIARTTKYLNFSAVQTGQILSDAVKVFTTDRWDLYSVVQSTLHEVWARKYSGALETRLRYSPSDCFETFPFPAGIWQTANPALAEIGERYHEHRRALMLQLWLGLTDIYNLFHTRDLTVEQVVKVSKKPQDIAEAGFHGILELRRLHRQIDNAIRDSYGWQDLDLGHDFHEVETLPENDRVRYTISPTARKEVLKRLLQLNHDRAAAQADAGTAKRKTTKSKKQAERHETLDLFSQENT